MLEMITWVAMCAIDAQVTLVMLWILAFPDHVALGSFLTELGVISVPLIDKDGTLIPGYSHLTSM